MNKNVVTLPFPNNPPVKSHGDLAYVTGILSKSLQKSAFDEWFYSNFTQLVWDTNSPDKLYVETIYLTSYVLPLKHTFMPIHESQISLIMDYLHEIINDSIKSGYYIHGMINERYLPYRAGFNKNDHLCDYLIYGYDDSNKIYRIAGYNGNGVFELNEIPYHLYEAGVSSIPVNDHITFFMFKHDENKTISYSFEKVSDDLYKYLKGIGDNRDLSYGCKIYEQLIKYIKYSYANYSKIDIRIFLLIHDHKVLMQKKLEYAYLTNHLTNHLENNQEWTNQYLLMAKDMKKIVKLIQNSQRINNTLIIKIIDIINNVAECETQVVKEIVSCLISKSVYS